MALFGMFKKRDISPPEKFDISTLDAELPPIDGSGLPPLENPDAQPLELPSLDVPDIDEPPDYADEGPKSSGLTVNIAPIDFSLPTPDIEMEPQTDQYPQSGQNPPAPSVPDFADVDENINKLFLSEEWKEPDWGTFDPYSDPQIEEPKPEDFGVAQQALEEAPQVPEEEMHVPSFDAPVQIEPLSDETEREVKNVPIELFVKGSDYRNVFSELGRINELLAGQDSKIGMIQGFTKKEDEDMARAKEGMEYIYRKLSLVDKKIFA